MYLFGHDAEELYRGARGGYQFCVSNFSLYFSNTKHWRDEDAKTAKIRGGVEYVFLVYELAKSKMCVCLFGGVVSLTTS